MPHCRRTYYYQVRRTFLQFGAYPEEVRRRSVSVDSPQVRWRELSPDIYAWRMERRSKHAAKASHLAGSGEGDGHVSQWREGSAALPSASVMGTRAGLAAPGTALMKTREGRPEFPAGSALPSSTGYTVANTNCCEIPPAPLCPQRCTCSRHPLNIWTPCQQDHYVHTDLPRKIPRGRPRPQTQSPCFSRRSIPLTLTREERWSAGLIVQVHLVKPLQASLTTMHTCLVPSNTHRGVHFLPVDCLHDHVSETKDGVRGRADVHGVVTEDSLLESDENKVCRNLLPIFDAAFQPFVALAQSDAWKQTDAAVIPAPERTWSATPLGGDTAVIARLPSPGGLYRVSCESRSVRHEIVLAAVRAQEATLRIQGETTPSPDPRSIGLGKYNFAKWLKDILNALWYRQPYQRIIESPLIATDNDSHVW